MPPCHGLRCGIRHRVPAGAARAARAVDRAGRGPARARPRAARSHGRQCVRCRPHRPASRRGHLCHGRCRRLCRRVFHRRHPAAEQPGQHPRTSVGCGDSSVVLDPFVKAFAGKAIRAKNWAETRLKETAMGWTILRSGGMTVRPGKAGPIAVESSQVVGYINRQDLGDVAWRVLRSPRSVGRIYAAVDRARAIHINGEPVVEADL
ncbi:MAG: hypothetical protein DYH20_15685 [Gammaproteobacteria bacterium PRO9]|nr:hypothetical protein [Gammaproteobacteria bacterium PRO9]